MPTKKKVAEEVEVVETAAAVETTKEVSKNEENVKTTAKAGKRSAKSVEAAREKQAKEERKASSKEESETKAKPVIKQTRSKLERRSKGYRKSSEQIKADQTYAVNEAVGLAQTTSHVKFDATVELHVNLGVDPRQADQNIRDNLILPAGTGKTVKIAVLTDDAQSAKKAGADIAGNDELLKSLDKGVIDFDILIAVPSLMASLGKYARVLGPRGLMPNPKSGTVTTDVAKAVADSKAGRVEYRVDSTGIVHIGIGKVSFDKSKLLENLNAVFASIKSNKPNSVKSNYIKAAYLSTTMGPSIKIDINTI